MNMLKLLEERVIKAFNIANVPQDTCAMVRPNIQNNFGDYQCDAVMAIAKKIGIKPKKLAQNINKHLNLEDFAEKIEIASPGFINIYCQPQWLASCIKNAMHDDRVGVAKVSKPQIIVVDYSAPNVAKEMHIGHIRSTIIGDSIAKTLEFLGHIVIRQNHLGDWGTQFGMLIAHLEELEQQNQEAKNIELSDIDTFYKIANKRFHEDENFADIARNYVVRLQSGDAYCLKLWKKIVDITLTHNQVIYKRMNVSLNTGDVMGESAYNANLPDVIRELDSKGLLSEDQGAKVVFLDDFKNKDGDSMGVIVEKSGGGFLYSTTDLAAIRYRTHALHANRILYYVDSRQKQYFNQIFTIARKAGFVYDDTSLEHHAVGMMLGKDGKPFKSRSGTNIKLLNLLNEAKERVIHLMDTKSTSLSKKQKIKVTNAVANGSVRYADLSKNRVHDYIFDLDNMLTFEGNTVLYLFYAYTRIKSIFRKFSINEANLTGKILVNEPVERKLALKLCQFHETIEYVASAGTPHVLCTYLYELSKIFMSFYEICPISKTNKLSETIKNSRLQICACTAKTLKIGLNLLGIETVEQM